MPAVLKVWPQAVKEPPKGRLRVAVLELFCNAFTPPFTNWVLGMISALTLLYSQLPTVDKSKLKFEEPVTTNRKLNRSPFRTEGFKSNQAART